METNNKLREALTKILNLTNSLDEDCAVDPVEIRDIARDALKERPKNCEVGTAEQQANRFLEFCSKDRPMISQPLRNQTICPLECPFNKSTSCDLAWAQMPYKEGGAK